MSEFCLRAPILDVSLSAIIDNWRFFAARGGRAECAAVVKADGYGLGAATIAAALAKAGCRSFFVATAGEGAALRPLLGNEPALFVLNGPSIADLAAYSAYDLTPTLNSLEQIALWRGVGGAAALHVDTGMNRLGLPMSDIGAAQAAFGGDPPILVMSHLACAASPADPMNSVQRSRFLAAAGHFPLARRSLAASAGALLGDEYAFDLLRPGLGLYGGQPLDSAPTPLQVAATLRAPILQIRKLAAGDTVGYGADFEARQPITAATVALGYADGFLRALSQKGYGFLEGARCPILGRVSMDLITLDVRAAGAAARPGAMVEFLGTNAPLGDLARLAGTAPYEILTSLTRVRRSYSGDAG